MSLAFFTIQVIVSANITSSYSSTSKLARIHTPLPHTQLTREYCVLFSGMVVGDCAVLTGNSGTLSASTGAISCTFQYDGFTVGMFHQIA